MSWHCVSLPYFCFLYQWMNTKGASPILPNVNSAAISAGMQMTLSNFMYLEHVWNGGITSSYQSSSFILLRKLWEAFCDYCTVRLSATTVLIYIPTPTAKCPFSHILPWTLVFFYNSQYSWSGSELHFWCIVLLKLFWALVCLPWEMPAYIYHLLPIGLWWQSLLSVLRCLSSFYVLVIKPLSYI